MFFSVYFFNNLARTYQKHIKGDKMINEAEQIPVAELVTGPYFNSFLQIMPNYSTATIVNFTKEAIPPDRIGGAKVVSTRLSKNKIYMYAVDDNTINVSPERDGITIYANTNCENMFYNFRTITTINFDNFNTSKVTNMNYMFYYCTSLVSLDLSRFDTANTITMISMFMDCRSLNSLDVSNFNTSKVTNMISMFEYCKSLPELDLSSFDIGNTIHMDYMFNRCPAAIKNFNL